MRAHRFIALCIFFAVACDSQPEPDSLAEDDALRLATRTKLEKAQYDANLSFAQGYTSRCRVIDSTLPRVIVTGYGRFMGTEENLTGLAVSALLGGAYPRPTVEAGKPVSPAESTAVTNRVLTLGGVKSNVCGMVLPVFWDLAPALVASEINGYHPDVVVMNGAGGPGKITLELGSTNMAATKSTGSLDGSDILGAYKDKSAPDGYARLVRSKPIDHVLPSYFAYAPVRAALEAELAFQATQADGQSMGEWVEGVQYGTFPRDALTYLCNNVIYTTNTLLENPGTRIDLLEDQKGARQLGVSIAKPAKAIARTFVHWPHAQNELSVAHAARLLPTLLGAALSARGKEVYGSEVTPDDNL